MSGEARGVSASLTRGALSLLEPLYRIAINRRNRGFDHHPDRIRKIPRPVISIGNLTTGGTGKTPIIRWLAAALRDRGLAVAILSRGYKAEPGQLGDEQRMLLAQLSADSQSPGGPPIEIECDPDRFAAGQRVLARSSAIDVFLLDDGFQHRRLHRDLDIVLLHAGEPFGYGHLLPRGLLREPPTSLVRAGAVIVTNVPREWPAELRDRLIRQIRRWNASAPIAFEQHAPVGFRSAGIASSNPADHPLSDLASRRVFVFSGLGSPGGFEKTVQSLAQAVGGARRFPDHHDYTAAEVVQLQQQATAAGADVLVTTEKDWVKLAGLPAATNSKPPIWRLDIAAQFLDKGEEELLSLVLRTVR